MRDLCRAADDIDRFVFEQFIAEPLCHTTNDGDNEVGFALFEMFEVS